MSTVPGGGSPVVRADVRGKRTHRRHCSCCRQHVDTVYGPGGYPTERLGRRSGCSSTFEVEIIGTKVYLFDSVWRHCGERLPVCLLGPKHDSGGPGNEKRPVWGVVCQAAVGNVLSTVVMGVKCLTLWLRVCMCLWRGSNVTYIDLSRLSRNET